MKKRRIDQQGQSLVEMIVVIGMVVLLATGIIAGTTASLSRSEASQTRSQALSYAQAGIELARAARDNGWINFWAKGSSGGTLYCVGSNGDFGLPQTSCTVFNIENKYIRSVTLQTTSVPGVPTMIVTSQVVWGGTTNPVYLKTYLTQWK